MADAKIVLQATDNASRVLDRVRSNLATTAQSAAALGGALSLAGVAGAGGILALVKGTVDSIDALNDLKDATGASIENLSALEDLAARTGTSFDSVGGALVKFNTTLKDASKPGSEAEQAFKALGLRVEELKKLDPAEALRRTSVALAGFADDGNKARLVQELFGKSVREAAPFLKNLAEQTQLVGTVTTQAAEEAEKFNREFLAMQKNATDLGRSLVSDLVIGINKAAQALRESGLIEGLRTLLTGDDQYKNNKRLVELTDDLFRAENDLARARAKDAQFGDRSLATAAAEKRLAVIKEELKTVQAYQKVLSEGINGPAKPDATKPSAPTIRSVINSKAKTETDEAAQALASYVKGLQSAVERTQELTEVEKARTFLLSLGRTGEIAQVKEVVLGLAEQIDKEKQLTQALEDKRAASIAAGDAVNKANEERAGRLSGLLDATPSANIDKQRQDMLLLTEEFEAGRLSEERYLEAVTARLDLTDNKIKETKSLAEDLGLTFSSAFEDAIVGGKNFSEVLKGLEQDIIRIVTRKMVTEPLGNALSGFMGGGGGGMGEAAATFFASIFGGARAEGGPVATGKAYLVGERGPEIFMPKGSGAIVPNHQMGGQTINFAPTFYLNAPVDRRTQDQLAAAALSGLRRGQRGV